MADVKDVNDAPDSKSVGDAPVKRSSRRRAARKGKASGSVESKSSNAPWQERKLNTPATGFTGTLRYVAVELKPLTQPERTYYRVNLSRLSTLACSFEVTLTSFPRRHPGWAPGGTYAAMFLRALCVKLQRVGVETNQLVFNSIDMCSHHLSLPAPIGLIIDTFGVKTDPQGVTISPLVTQQLIMRLNHLIAVLERPGQPARQPVQMASEIDQFVDVYWSYGPYPFLSDCLNRIASMLNVPRGFIVTDRDQFLDALRYLFQTHRRFTGNGDGALSAANATTVLEFFTPTGAVKAAYAGPANMLAAFSGAIAAVGVRTVDPLIADLGGNYDGDLGIDQPYVLLSANRVMRRVNDYAGELTQLSSMFHMSEANYGTIGSFAPTVSAVNEYGNYSGTTSVSGLTPEEYAVGIALDHMTELTDRAGYAFNVYDETRRRKRYYCTPVTFSPSELFTRMLGDDFTARTVKK